MTAQTQTDKFAFLPLAQLHESKHNPRTVFGDVDELAAAIKEQGVLQPLLVRPRPNNGAGFEIVAGARRYRAAKKLTLAFLPCIVRELADKETLQAQVAENAHRVDVHPLDEAEAIDRLIHDHRMVPAEVAGKLSRSLSHVRQRLQLLKLCPEGRKASRDGKLPVMVALQVSRIPSPSLQKEAIKEIAGADLTQTAMLDLLQEKYRRRLSLAIFDTKDPHLEPHSCGDCPKRTGNQAEMFGDAKKEPTDLCLDGACYERKSRAAWTKISTDARAKGWSILPQDEVRRVFGRGDEASKKSGYVDGDADADVKPGKTWKKLMGRHSPDPILALSPELRVHRLYRRAAARKAAVANGHKDLAPEKPKLDLKDQKVRARIATANEVIRGATVEKEDVRRQVVDVLVAEFPRGVKLAAERYAKEDGVEDKGKYLSHFKKVVGRATGAHLNHLIAEIVLGPSVRDVSRGYSRAAKAVARATKLNLAAAEKRHLALIKKDDEATDLRARGEDV